MRCTFKYKVVGRVISIKVLESKMPPRVFTACTRASQLWKALYSRTTRRDQKYQAALPTINSPGGRGRGNWCCGKERPGRAAGCTLIVWGAAARRRSRAPGRSGAGLLARARGCVGSRRCALRADRPQRCRQGGRVALRHRFGLLRASSRCCRMVESYRLPSAKALCPPSSGSAGRVFESHE